MEKQNKFVFFAKVIFVPAVALNLIMMCVLTGLTWAKIPYPDWLIAICLVILGLSMISWVTVNICFFIEEVLPLIKQFFKNIKYLKNRR